MRLWLKMGLVLVMTLAILIPLMMISGTINERQTYRSQAVNRVARSYAGAQSFVGPVVVAPFVETVWVEDKNDKGEVIRRYKGEGDSGRVTFFPNRMDITGSLVPSTRRVGLHEVRVYKWQGAVVADFRDTMPADVDPELPRKFGRPWLSFAVADVRGLLSTPTLKIDGRLIDLEEGQGLREGGGVHARLAVPVAGQPLQFSTRLDVLLGGTESLALVPIAKSNRFALDSQWPHPSFGGSFLPNGEPQISTKGFKAQWEISSLATNAQAQYIAAGKTLPEVNYHPEGYGGEMTADGLDAAGVSLVDPVNVYSTSDRATKYGILFVVLTFVGFFMFELIKRLPIHPIQYGLVGLALVIFFLLLLGLSEHIEFGIAYLVASVACVGLLGFYLSAVLRSVLRGLGFAVMLATLYGALYGLLVSEDNALLLGSGLLFVILAAIMMVTRKVDWYQLGSGRPLSPLPNPSPDGRGA